MNRNDSRTNLIINYLPQTYTDNELFSLFSSAGSVKSCKIIRDKSSGYSYGFGFVEYVTAEQALSAIQTLNGYEILNKRIKVAFARPPGEDTKGANLYVRNIPLHYGEEEMRNLFCRFGVIVQVRVLTDHVTGGSKGVGFVLFESKGDAEVALHEMNGFTPEDGTAAFNIKFADDNAKKVRPPPQQMGYSGFNPSYSAPMRQGGPMRAPSANRSRYNPMGSGGSQSNNGYGSYGGGYTGGYGSPRGRAPAMGNPIRGPSYSQFGAGNGYGAGDGFDSGDRFGAGVGDGFGAGDAFGAGSGAGGVTLFAYNIGTDATKQDLFNLFSPYGSVLKVDIIWDHKKNQCKGFGFVTLSNMDEANYAIEYLNGYVYKGAQLQVSIKSDKQ